MLKRSESVEETARRTLRAHVAHHRSIATRPVVLTTEKEFPAC